MPTKDNEIDVVECCAGEYRVSHTVLNRVKGHERSQGLYSLDELCNASIGGHRISSEVQNQQEPILALYVQLTRNKDVDNTGSCYGLCLVSYKGQGTEPQLDGNNTSSGVSKA